MKKRIVVEGMKCGNCVRHVKTVLEELNGVTNERLGEIDYE